MSRITLRGKMRGDIICIVVADDAVSDNLGWTCRNNPNDRDRCQGSRSVSRWWRLKLAHSQSTSTSIHTSMVWTFSNPHRDVLRSLELPGTVKVTR